MRWVPPPTGPTSERLPPHPPSFVPFGDQYQIEMDEARPRRRHPVQRAVSLLVVVAMAVLIGSGAAALEARLHSQVNPTTRDSPTSGPSTPSPASASQLLSAVAATDLPEIVMVVAVGTSSEELGTAWPLDNSGDFLTNDHVVHMGLSFHVVLDTGQQYAAEVINDDPALDLAEIHVWSLREAPLPIDSSPPPIGEPVVVLAAAAATGHAPVTESKVNGLDQTATVSNARPGELADYSGLFRMPAKIFPGNSGGPVITPQGRVVGILTLAAESGTGAFAIPISQVDLEIQGWLAG